MNKLITLGLFALLFSACASPTSQSATETSLNATVHSHSIKTTQAILNTRNEELTLNGKIGYNPDKVISYVPLVSGVVNQTYFSLGDKVQKGQTLLDVRSSELTALQSELVASKYEVQIAERELRTAQSMFEDSMLSEKEMLEAQARLKQAEMSVTKLKNDMLAIGKDKGNGLFAITAPMTGYVVSKQVSSGTTLSTDSEPLFTIADLSTVWIMANVYANNLLYVKEGMEVRISTPSYGKEEFAGKINALSQVFDPEEKVLKARIVMNNKDLKLKPEMSVIIRLKEEMKTETVSVPSDALLFVNDAYYLVVQKENNAFEARKVIPDGHYKGISYIADGLLAGETIVTQNQLLIYSALKGS